MKLKLVGFLTGSIALGGMLVGCGGSSGGNNNNGMTIDGTNNSQFATSGVTLPSKSSDFAWDLDGDGNPDDKLGSLIGILNSASQAGAMPQDAVNSAVQSGKLLALLKETSTDATQQKATNAGVTFEEGATPASPPKYDGTDTFMGTGSVSTFYGNIAGGVFTSHDPAHMSTATDITVGLPLVTGANPVMLPVTAGRITFTVGSDGKVTGGQINGAIKKTDLDNTVIPAVAALLTAKLQADTTGKLATELMGLGLDKGGNNMVTAAEIESSPTLSQFLAPDIQMFAADGTTYHPTPNGTMKDCLSLGMGFTAVKASF